MSAITAEVNNQQASTTQQQPVPQEIVFPVINNNIVNYWAHVDWEHYQAGLYQFDFEEWKDARDYRDPPIHINTTGFDDGEEQELQFDNLSKLSDEAYLQEIHIEQLQRQENRAREHQQAVDQAWTRAPPTTKFVVYLALDSGDKMISTSHSSDSAAVEATFEAVLQAEALEVANSINH